MSDLLSAVPPGPHAVASGPAVAGGAPIRQTRGLCPACQHEVPAAVVRREGAAYLERHCPEHGVARQLLARRGDAWADLDRHYFAVHGAPHPQRDYIVRMTERCNLQCPICLASANTQDTPDLDLPALESLLSSRRRIKVDLMAAEPTLRPDLADWIRAVKARGHVAALHTNGLRLVDPAATRRLKEAGLDEVFLQFDGLDDEANRTLRGRRLLKPRLRALANLREAGLATSLIAVIARGVNEAQVGETLRFALRPENDHIREFFALGLRRLGGARHDALGEQAMMPHELIDLLCQQEPAITPGSVHDFNLVYFTLLSALRVRKCLYVQHYLVERDGEGGFLPISDRLDLARLAAACRVYADRHTRHPNWARAGLATALARAGLAPAARAAAPDLLTLQRLLASGFDLGAVPRRFLLLGFITACDVDNFDAQVAAHCGKGELSRDGGFTESGAVANVLREGRLDRAGPVLGSRGRPHRPSR